MIKRRGISSVVGTVFAIIALASTVGYITYSMNVLDNYNQSILARNQQATDVTKEKFQVSSVTMVNNKLNITVANTGSIPVNFTKIWITNKSATTTAWVKSYTPTSSVAAPGNTLTNLGINGISTWLNTNYPYHVKLVTSRGNTNEFDVNSASTAPLNIQLLATPPNVPSGFSTQMIMMATNNSTGIVTNLIPNSLATYGTPTATCTPGTVSPTKYNTLSPGSTAVFSWPVKVTGGSSASCTLSASLQNGYTKNYANTTLTAMTVSLSSTTFAQDAGIMTMNYTTFQWTQGNIWNTGWSLPHGAGTVFSIKLTNNNSTGTFYISKNTQLYFSRTGGSNAYRGFIANATTLSPLSTTAYSGCNGVNDYCYSIAPGQSITINIGAGSVGGTGTTSLGQADNYLGFLLIYGKFANSQTGQGTYYAQTLPFLALTAT